MVTVAKGVRHFTDEGSPAMLVGEYYHDGKRLVEVLESDPRGALVMDAKSYEWVEVDETDVASWTLVPRSTAAEAPEEAEAA